MGKSQKKKGKGAEKTAAKTDKKLTQKMKKQLAVAGEEDIEAIVAKLEKEEQKKLQVTEKIITTPNRRAFVSLTAHPFKDELIMFGGEFHNGQETVVYNDLFIYKISKNEWTIIRGPGLPPPRSSHQAVAVGSNKGELWVFGGEFTTKSESQFHHYKDLWVLNLETKQWTKVNAPGGPSARSGHRIVCLKRNLIVFGGYHDNLHDYKYFNDIYAFNLDERKWVKLEPSGTGPSPRSGCQMAVTPEGKVLIWGGYSKVKVKKDVDSGTVHNDMFLLSPEKGDTTGIKWKWSIVKPGGMKYEGRSGVSATFTSDRCYTFGGTTDQETEEDISAQFFDELHSLDLKKYMWTLVSLSGKKEEQKKRRRVKEKEDCEEEEVEEVEEEKMEEEVKEEEVVTDDGVFTMKIGPSKGETAGNSLLIPGSKIGPPNPHSRINSSLVIKGSKLYLYGGIFEDGDKEYTLCDFHCLDLHKLDEWKTLIPCDLDDQEWIESGSDMETGSESSSSEEEEEDEEVE